jgi:small subunit ribosomal protein S16
MAVVLRLARLGQRNRPFYRIVATRKESRRDGRFLDILGHYNPMKDSDKVVLKEDRVRHWLEHGAKPSDRVAIFIKAHIPGFLESKTDAQREKIQNRRRERKERNKANSATA